MMRDVKAIYAGVLDGLWKQFSHVNKLCSQSSSSAGVSRCEGGLGGFAPTAQPCHDFNVGLSVDDSYEMRQTLTPPEEVQVGVQGSGQIRYPSVLSRLQHCFLQLESSDPAQPFTVFDCLWECLIFFSLLILPSQPTVRQKLLSFLQMGNSHQGCCRLYAHYLIQAANLSPWYSYWVEAETFTEPE